MKEVDDALLTALAENCRQLTHVSIKGCGLVSILSGVKKCSGEGGLLFVLFYCKLTCHWHTHQLTSSHRELSTVKVKSADVPSSLPAGAYAGFLSMKQLAAFLFPHNLGWDANPSQGYPPALRSPPFIHLGGERHCETKLSCQRTQHLIIGHLALVLLLR